jgi:hypothetical protein
MAKDLLNLNLPKIVVAWYTPIRGMSYEYLYISHRGSLWKEFRIDWWELLQP